VTPRQIPRLAAQIIAKADGVPLFVEEYARMLAERGGAQALDIPVTLAGLVQGKIDRLPPQARRLAQGGGLRLNDEAIADGARLIEASDVNADGVLKLAAGKKKLLLVKPI
jgi:tyrosyl-tRNA synthetase